LRRFSEGKIGKRKEKRIKKEKNCRSLALNCRPLALNTSVVVKILRASSSLRNRTSNGTFSLLGRRKSRLGICIAVGPTEVRSSDSGGGARGGRGIKLRYSSQRRPSNGWKGTYHPRDLGCLLDIFITGVLSQQTFVCREVVGLGFRVCGDLLTID
jgi:hypothetical protein